MRSSSSGASAVLLVRSPRTNAGTPTASTTPRRLISRTASTRVTPYARRRRLRTGRQSGPRRRGVQSGTSTGSVRGPGRGRVRIGEFVVLAETVHLGVEAAQHESQAVERRSPSEQEVQLR